MPQTPARTAEPRHRGGAGRAARADLPPWHTQKVKIPRRVWGEGRYSPGAVAYWAQIAALALRADGCRASVATLAGYLGDSKRTAERHLAELAAPGPDGAPELSTIRRTGADGDGETAERRTRPCGGGHFAYVPITAAKTLRHPLFVAYCALTYAVATRTPVTAAELAELLGVTERSARRMTDELERLGWITVHRRAGAHGRHAYDVHDHPLHPVDTTPARPDTDGGSGASADGGSLAIKEDAGWTDTRNTEAGGAFRRRRGDRSKPGAPVENPAPAPGPVPGPTPGPVPGGDVPEALRGPATARPYDGPALTLSPRVWAVLAPVRDLLPACSTFMVRRIAREIGRQLDAGILAEDIRDQLTRLRAWTPPEAITDPGRWIYGAALPARPGPCGRPGCHYGFQHHTGLPCKECAEITTARRTAHSATARSRSPGPPRRHHCTECHRPTRQPLPAGLCHTCRPTATA
ncbi:hypothetical protein [Streptomyces sp. bgisy154]|uniref:hypothetical protein n=1 Tax=Streptomyces sp. bgisy154 TaxID=3413794 RepID=UPI003D73D010